MHRSMLSPCVWLFARLPYHSYLFVYLYNLYSSTHQLMLFDMNLLASNLNLVILPKLKLFIIIHLYI